MSNLCQIYFLNDTFLNIKKNRHETWRFNKYNFGLFPLKNYIFIVNIFVHVLYKDLTLFIYIIPFSTECIS